MINYYYSLFFLLVFSNSSIFQVKGALSGININVAGNRRPTLTPNSETASFSTEQKRLSEDLLLMINQAKHHTLDELKRMVNTFQAADSSMKTDIGMVKTEITNNMKRHLSMILTQLSSLYNLFATEWPKDKQFQYNMMRDLLAKLNGIQIVMDKHIQYWESFGKLFDAAMLDQRDVHKQILGALDVINKNTDLSNTDTNTVGRQITEMAATLESVADAISVIDRRLPGIDMNGDGLMRNLNSIFDAINMKLDKLIALDVTVATLSERVELVIQKIADSNFPRNDNHLATGMPTPPGLGVPLRPMEYEL